MSVIVSERRESKFEAVVYSIEIHNMLREFMQRNFGIKDLQHFVRTRYLYHKDDVEDFEKYYYLLITHKKNIDTIASQLTNNVRAANSIYPTSLHEYEQRRDFQNFAIVNCEQLVKELQCVAETFDTNINGYKQYINAIDREIDLIKRWRQRDNKIKSRLH